MATMISQGLAEAQEANDTVRWFIRRFEVGKLLRICRANKAKGFSVVELFTYLLCCMFSPISTYMSMRIGSYKESFSKNTIYRFCNTDGINWHKFVRLLSEEVIDRFIRPATSDKRLETTGVFVIQTDYLADIISGIFWRAYELSSSD